MTVTYTGEVATCTGLGCFWKLLFRWRGSIYKLLWPNLIVYSILYFSLSGTYRFLLNTEQRTLFEKMSLHCQVYGDLIPVSFVLGFYVSLVIKRWWDQYLCLPWPDNLALFVSSLVHGQDDRGRIMRRTIMRYVNLSLLLTLRMISPRVKKRFPTLDHVVEAGWMLPGEKKIFEDLEQKTLHAKYWMPLVWAGGIVTRARKENRIKDDFALKTLIDELNIFRGGCGGMLNYDWISIPLVYTQVVTLAVYVFFLSTLMGNQYLDPNKGYPKHQIDLIMPIFTFLQFFFYMGWLKVAESLVNPFGEDDDDFELNWLLDRNLQISYVIVDEMHQEHPEMLKDQYWDEVFPVELPYTAAAKQYQTGPPQYSAEEVEVPLHKSEFMPLDSVMEERIEEPESDSQDMEIELEHPSVQRGETHPMKIKRRSRSSSTATSVSGRSVISSKGGRSSVLNMLSRIFHHPMSSKEEVNQLGSSVSLRSRRGNRSTSRVSSVSHSIAPSRCSFVRESVPYNDDYQCEVFSMSDLDLVGSIPATCDEVFRDEQMKTDASLDNSQSSVLTTVYKEGGDDGDSETSPSLHKKNEDTKPQQISGLLNIERKDISSPSQIFHGDLFARREPRARVVVQSNSPVYHMFAPITSTAFLPATKSPFHDAQAKFPYEDEKAVEERLTKQPSLCPESLITILPPVQVQRFSVMPTPVTATGEADTNFQFSRPEAQSEAMFKPSPSSNFSYEDSYPHLSEPVQPPLYTCAASTPTFPASGMLKSSPTSTFPEVMTAGPLGGDVFFSQSQAVRDDKIEKSTGDIFGIPPCEGLESTSAVESTIPVPPPLLESVIKIEMELTGPSAPDPSTPSAAIPVPAMSQAHAQSPVEMDLGRRPIMHELEPIIEHKDEGVSSPGSSVQDLRSETSIDANQCNRTDGLGS